MGRDRLAFCAWLIGPCRTDGFVGCEAAKGLQASGEVVAVQEGGEVFLELAVSPFRFLGRSANWAPLSVSTVWIL